MLRILVGHEAVTDAGRPVKSPTRVCRGVAASFCGRRWNGYCSDRCRLHHQTERRAETLTRLLPDDPGRPE